MHMHVAGLSVFDPSTRPDGRLRFDDVAGVMASRLLPPAARDTADLVVSNIPRPQQPMYLAGARLVANYPSMLLGENSALSIACTSMAGTMAYGLTGASPSRWTSHWAAAKAAGV
jgi:hypothetical protein